MATINIKKPFLTLKKYLTDNYLFKAKTITTYFGIYNKYSKVYAKIMQRPQGDNGNTVFNFLYYI